jgi:hypothetical protein
MLRSSAGPLLPLVQTSSEPAVGDLPESAPFIAKQSSRPVLLLLVQGERQERWFECPRNLQTRGDDAKASRGEQESRVLVAAGPRRGGPLQRCLRRAAAGPHGHPQPAPQGQLCRRRRGHAVGTSTRRGGLSVRSPSTRRATDARQRRCRLAAPLCRAVALATRRPSAAEAGAAHARILRHRAW